MLHDPLIEITCDGDGCSVIDSIGLTACARGYDERNVEDAIEGKGWVTIGDNRHLCEDCVAKREEQKQTRKRGRDGAHSDSD